MMTDSVHGDERGRAPVVAGTGMITFDAIHDPSDGSYRFAAGGTCLNVLVILSVRGWEATISGQIGTDFCGDEVLRDLRRWNADTRWIRRAEDLRTPIYIETTTQDGHRFLHHCPDCGMKFPNSEPVSVEWIEELAPSLPDSLQVCYIEQVSASSVRLAEICKERGACVYFEPDHIDDLSMYKRCLAVTDILKYAHDKMHGACEGADAPGVPLEIETLGAEGLRYRMAGGDWIHVPPVPCGAFVSAAGSGDWLSACFIDEMVRAGKGTFPAVNASDVYAALVAAQAVASENCKYRGARGMLYKTVELHTDKGFCPYC